MYDDKGEVPDEAYTIPFGVARLARTGSDITICALGRMVNIAGQAAEILAKKNIECTVIDMRTASPLDADTIIESVEETGHLVVVDEGYPRCGLASDIAGLAATRAFYALEAPVSLVTPPHTPVPFAPVLEALYIPSVARIVAAVEKTLEVN